MSIEKKMGDELRRLKTWDNGRYTLEQACKEIHTIKGIEPTQMRSEVEALITAGPTMPILEKRKLNDITSPLPGKRKLICKCLHPASRGVCVLGCCVNISKDGWIISINI